MLTVLPGVATVAEDEVDDGARARAGMGAVVVVVAGVTWCEDDDDDDRARGGAAGTTVSAIGG